MQGDQREVTLTGTQSQVFVARALVEGRLAQTPDEGKFYASTGGAFRGLFGGAPINLTGAPAPRPAAGSAAGYQAPGAYGAVAGPLVTAYAPRGEQAATSSTDVFVPVSMIGRIIGKGGSHIKQLKSQSGAEVVIAKEDEKVDGAEEPQRRVTLTGSNVALILADGLMRAKMAETGEREATETEMKIPDSRAGQVIGKGGATIRMIKETSGAELTMSKPEEMEEGSNERLIVLKGTASQCLIAQTLILAKMAHADGHDSGSQ